MLLTKEEIAEIKTNALALRNLASKVLELVERAENKPPALLAKTKRSKKEIIDMDLIERFHTGRRKPILAKQKQK